MAQEASWALIAAQAETSRTVVFGVYIDFDDLGFGVSATEWTDVSEFVKRITGDHQATDWRKSPAIVGSGVVDEVTVTLRNPEETSPYTGLRYSSSNTGSSLYGEIGNGLINMKRAIVAMGFTYSGTDYGTRQITGYITGVDEGRSGRNITLTIRDRAADASMTRTSTALWGNLTAQDYMEELSERLDKDPLTSAEQLFDRGMMVLPWVWLDDDTIWDEMSYVAEAQLGRVWFDKDGNLHFDDGSHFVKPNDNSYDDATVSQHTFTTGNVQSIDSSFSMGSIFNHIVVEYHPRYVGTWQVIYEASEPIIIRPGASHTTRCEFRYPIYEAPYGYHGIDTLGITISACTAGGVDLSSDISYTLTTYATYAEVVLTNDNDNFSAYVYQLDIEGQPLLSDQPDKYEVEDTTSITQYGRRTWRIANPYIQTYHHAEMVGDYLLARCKDPIHVVRIAGARGVPWLEVGDRVLVQDTLTDIDDYFFLTHIRWSFAPGSPYTMDIAAMKASDIFPYLDEYFVLGTNIYGRPAGTDIGLYGRYFW